MRKILLFLCCFATVTLSAQTVLFHSVEGEPPYRIPAIATAKNGDLIALSDYRPCKNDIGFGRVDIMQRVSKDNGQTWDSMKGVLIGTGEGDKTGFGDACLVADRSKNELLLVCAAGNVTYWKSNISNPQRIVTLHAKLNKKTGNWDWDAEPTDMTDRIYRDLLHDSVPALFMGSGKICQSSRIKAGRYYRIYGALCTHAGNFVLYSDDFGRSWAVLGDSYKVCVPKGDEPKCEELPNGDVVISSRKDGGRYFNIFHYTDQKKAEGAWDKAVDSRECPGGISNTGTPTNGEIMIVKVKKTNDNDNDNDNDNENENSKLTTHNSQPQTHNPKLKTQNSKRSTYLALQSVPAGPKRSNVTIYYKELATEADFLSSEAFASNWQGSYQVSHVGSAYSTFTRMRDNRIGFYYEEEPQNYQMVFLPLTIEEITNGQFK